MIKLAYCNVENLDLKKAYRAVPENRKNKIDFFKFDKDKKLSAGAFLLLKKLLSEQNITDFKIKIGKYDKPSICDHENIYFNLSHSGKMVLCSISDREVGVDVEYIDSTIDLDIAKHFFYNSEYERIMNAENKPDEFFKYWVLKESYMKYTGLGMNLELDSFEIIIDGEIRLDGDEKDLKFNLFGVEDYKIAVASHYDVFDLIEYDVGELY
jgi:4'-phosphopantetheinyl transferase